jgi:hypothetical protein
MALGETGVAHRNIAVGSALVALAGSAVLLSGLVAMAVEDWRPHAPPLLIGGGAGLVISFPLLWGFGVSGANSGREAATEAMNAVDRYNDEYLHRERRPKPLDGPQKAHEEQSTPPDDEQRPREEQSTPPDDEQKPREEQSTPPDDEQKPREER